MTKETEQEMSKDLDSKPSQGAPEQMLDRAQLETAKVLLLNEREEAQEALTKASLKAALPGGDDADLEVAEDRLRRIDQKLAGLTYGIGEAKRQEKERDDAERAVRRREEAETLWSLTYQRFWAVMEADEAMKAFDAAREKIKDIGHQLMFHAHNVLGGDENALRLFLLDACLNGATDTSNKITQDIGRETPRYSGAHFMGLPRAREALGRVVPEALEKEFEERAIAAARRDSAEGDGEQPLAA
jgi:hypothetical protein